MKDLKRGDKLLYIGATSAWEDLKYGKVCIVQRSYGNYFRLAGVPGLWLTFNRTFIRYRRNTFFPR